MTKTEKRSAESADFKRGVELRGEMFGLEVTENQINNTSDFLEPMQDVVTKICFGDIWQRPGLDLKTRSLITLAMLVALGREHEVKIHTRGALSNGATREEIRELMIHSFLYCGIPLMVGGMTAAESVLDELDAK
ncbi:MAG: carboxymuconolactone decarboxylase family protein [Rhizobiaceae bacterium]|nr:carboxymuconolactone decarboxylase family protein [Rhizobiaceae bacterium]MBL4732075.1 carboxymuconolactone decarboxylase family protein [Rhizobiaceae bacterium]